MVMLHACNSTRPVLMIGSGLVGGTVDPVSAAWYRATALVIASTGSYAMLQYEVLHSYHHAALPNVRTRTVVLMVASPPFICPLISLQSDELPSPAVTLTLAILSSLSRSLACSLSVFGIRWLRVS